MSLERPVVLDKPVPNSLISKIMMDVEDWAKVIAYVNGLEAELTKSEDLVEAILETPDGVDSERPCAPAAPEKSPGPSLVTSSEGVTSAVGFLDDSPPGSDDPIQ